MYTKFMKNNLIKILFLLMIAIAFIPNVALAVWWNPLSWSVFGFLKHTDVTQEASSTTEVTAKKKIALTNTEIINSIKPATVFIETSEGRGSGMIIDSDGYVLTNAHVVEGVYIADIKLSDGQDFSARVEGRDEIYDIAILKITPKRSSSTGGLGFWDSIIKNNESAGTPATSLPEFSHVSLGDSDTVYQGEEVFSLGYPFGLEGDVSFKEGTISRTITTEEGTYLETSAEIHPGNSGGPLVNRFGEVIGITSGGIGDSVNDITIGETIKLAIPINVAKDLIPDLKDGKEVLIEHEEPAPKQKPQARQPQPSAPVETSSTPDPGTFQMKAQCTVLGQQKQMQEDQEWNNRTGNVGTDGGTVSWGYSPGMNTCVYGRVYVAWDRDSKVMFMSAEIKDLMTGSRIYHITSALSPKSADLDAFELELKKFWAFYNSIVL